MHTSREQRNTVISLLSFFLPVVVSVLVSPPLSSAQPAQTPTAGSNDGRASFEQPALPDGGTALSDRETQLRQAEDDLLKKLSGSLPASDQGAPTNTGSAIVVANAPVQKPTSTPVGAVLAERLGAAPATPQSTPSSVSQAAVVQAAAIQAPAVAPLTVCPPCNAAPIVAPVAKRSGGKGGTYASSSQRSKKESTTHFRDEFAFRGRSDDCSVSIDDPYVPTSEKARVTVTRAHLRIAPGRSESTLFTMPRDSIVSIETRDGEWYRVVTTTGIRGWLFARDVVFDYGVPESSSVSVQAYKAGLEPTGVRY